MKFVLTIFLTVFILVVSPAYAELIEPTEITEITETAEIIDESNNEEIKTTNNGKPFIAFKYGATASWLTRIIEQSERSNFVFEDFLPGLFFASELQNIKLIVPEIRIAAYYSLLSEFNDVQQLPKIPLHFGADLFTGFRFRILEWSIIKVNAGPGFHMFFLTSDRWYYLNIGGAAVVGFELAISQGWSFLIDGFASLDNGNLGDNKLMEPFDISYQYQVAVGARYSKKLRNKSAIFMPKAKEQLITYDR